MPITRINKAGAGGLNKDISPVELPVGDVDNFTWSDAYNMRFLDGYATQFYGHGIVYESPEVTPYFLMPLMIGDEPHWIYAGEEAIYCVVLTTGFGSDIVSNGTFDTVTDGWGEYAATISIDTARLKLTNDGAEEGFSWQELTTVVGKTYTVTWDAIEGTSGKISIRVGYGANLGNYLQETGTVLSGTAPGTLTFVAETTTTAITFKVGSAATGETVLVDNVVAREHTRPIEHTNLSGTTYTATPNSWTGGVLGGIPILNNGTDDPQQWDTDVDNNFEDLSNWPASTTCKALRVYKQFLVAMDVTISGTNYPYMVKWSHPAVPGAVPASWDNTDETVDAGQTDLAEGAGHIIDGLQLRDVFIIYREGSIWIMTYTGGSFVFSFRKMLGTSGVMNRNCIVEFDGYHFVLTESDMLVHDGNTALPVLDKQVRRDVFRNIDSDARNVAFVLKNPFFNEIWVCYPSVGATSCDKAIIWNYRDKTVSFKDIPDVYHGSYGQIDEAVTDPWSDDDDIWSNDTTRWNEAANTPGNIRALLASADDELYLVDAGGEGAPTSSYLERRGLVFGAAEKRTLVKGIRPRITGEIGSTIEIKVGGTDDDAYATPTYDSTVDYVIGEDIRADMLVDRRYLAIKFENDNSASEWQLDSFDIEWEDGGLW